MNPSEKTPEKSSAARATSSTDRRRNRKKSTWLFVGAAVLAIGLLAGGVTLAYPGIKAARARQHAAEAESALRKGDLESAGTKVKAALAMGPKLPEVLRAAARYCSLQGDPTGINYYQMILATPAGTLADKTNLIALAHATSRLGPAREELRKMLTANSNDVVALRYLVENHILGKDRDRAIKTAAIGLKANPTNAWFQLTLGSLLIDDPRGGKYQDEGRRLLFSLAIGKGPEHIDAQNRIAQAQDLTKAEAAVLQKQIQSRTNLTHDDEVLIYDLRRRQNPDQAAALVKEAVNRYAREDPTAGLAAVLTWAAKGKQFAPILASLPAAAAETNRWVAPTYAAVLAESGKWAELEKFVSGGESFIGKTLAAGFRARVAMAKGNTKEAEALFRSLGGTQEIPVLDARILAQQAEAAGLPGVAVEIYQRLATDPAITLEAARQCVRLLGALEDIKQIREVAGRLAKAFPQEDTLVAEAAWANLVANEEIPEAWAALLRLHEKTPSDPNWRFGLALAELKMDRPQKALALIQESAAAAKSLSPRMQLSQVLTLGANQQRDAAQRLARQIELKRLRPAERALLTPWL
jgi:hypothetical protein